MGCRACKVLWKGSKSVLRMYLCYRLACPFCFLCCPRLFPPWYGGWGRQIPTAATQISGRWALLVTRATIFFRLGAKRVTAWNNISRLLLWFHGKVVSFLHGPFPSTFTYILWTFVCSIPMFWLIFSNHFKNFKKVLKSKKIKNKNIKNVEVRQQPTLCTINYNPCGFLISRSHWL